MWGMWFVIGGLLFGLFYVSYSIRSGIYLKAFCKSTTRQKVIALTFDDGPDPIQTPLVLEILKKYKVKATFFCVGEKSLEHQDILERIVKEGHLLGNHSWTHKSTFPLFSRKRMREELENTQQLLESVARQKVVFFRPPFGVTNPTVATVVKQLQYQVIGWSVRSLDTCTKEVGKVFERVRRKICPGAVVLLHDRLPESGVLLEMILQYLKEQEYKVVRVDEMMEL